MNLQDLRDIDLQNIGRAPLPVRLTLIGLIMAATLAAGYQLDIRDLIEQRDAIRAKEPELKQQVELKQQQAANLNAYKAQLVEMEKAFGNLLRQLPSKQEAENLIVDVAQTSLANGLKNQQIQPGQEIIHDFYAELPYTLRLQGSFHQLAKFASDTAALPRIVTLHDFTVSKDPKGDNELLNMEITAKTYRYLEESEMPKPDPKQPKAKGKS
ncbi:MAG: type 4a pilus biogenesis protein PilO [Halothiobacillaceae bacterium]